MCDDILNLDADQKSQLTSSDPGAKTPFHLIAALMGPRG